MHARTRTPALLLPLLLLLLAGGCHRPRLIPDEKLSLIFHDIYLTNAYIEQQKAERDSTKVYEPIFEKYGYTTSDLQYTVASFARRKSARLSDVVEEAVRMLERESDAYNHRVAVLDTVEAVARRTFSRLVHADSLLPIRRPGDTARASLRLPITQPGDYRLTYFYRIDSLDRNTSQHGAAWLETDAGTPRDLLALRYRRPSRVRVEHTFSADSSVRALVLRLARYDTPMTRPSMRIDSLRVDYFLPTAWALDSLAARNFDFKWLVDGFFTPDPPDSTTFFVEPPRMAPASDRRP